MEGPSRCDFPNVGRIPENVSGFTVLREQSVDTDEPWKVRQTLDAYFNVRVAGPRVVSDLLYLRTAAARAACYFSPSRRGYTCQVQFALIVEKPKPSHYTFRGVIHSGLSCAGLFIRALTELESLQGRVGSLKGSPGVCCAGCCWKSAHGSSYRRPTATGFSNPCFTETGNLIVIDSP